MSVLESVTDSFASVDPGLVAVALCLQLASFCFRSLAWRNILGAAYPSARVPFLGVATAYGTGIALNALVPARGGDVAKIALLRSRIAGSSVATIVATIGVLSAFDAVVGVSFLLAAWAAGLLPAFPVPPGPPGLDLAMGHPWVVGAALVPLAALLGWLARALSGRLRSFGRHVLRGLAVIRSPRRYALEVVPVQLTAWSCRVGAAFFLLAAFHVPATIPAAVLVVVVGGIAAASPTPGGAGTQQLALAFVLSATASTASIVAFSVGMQLAVTTLNVAIGLTALMLTFRTLRPAAAIRAGIDVSAGLRRSRR